MMDLDDDLHTAAADARAEDGDDGLDEWNPSCYFGEDGCDCAMPEDE